MRSISFRWKITVFLAFTFFIAPASISEAGAKSWTSISNEQALNTFLTQEFARKFYPTDVKCRERGGGLQVKFSVKKVGPNKPYHRWNATLLRSGETQAEAAARLPIKGHEEHQYQVKFGCSAAGKTLLVMFRGDRALE